MHCRRNTLSMPQVQPVPPPSTAHLCTLLLCFCRMYPLRNTAVRYIILILQSRKSLWQKNLFQHARKGFASFLMPDMRKFKYITVVQHKILNGKVGFRKYQTEKRTNGNMNAALPSMLCEGACAGCAGRCRCAFRRCAPTDRVPRQSSRCAYRQGNSCRTPCGNGRADALWR